MSLFAEFELPASEFALRSTLAAEPDAVVEVERVVAADELLTPYFWIGGVDGATFEAAAESDDSIRNLRRLDDLEESTLYRAEWTEDVEAVVHAYTDVGAVILDATGQRDSWEVQLRFDDREQLAAFQSYCAENDVSFTLQRLFEVSQAHTGRQYGLTEKQHEALVAAWKAGFFESPAATGLESIAGDLDISQQALSERLRSGYDNLVRETLITDETG